MIAYIDATPALKIAAATPDQSPPPAAACPAGGTSGIVSITKPRYSRLTSSVALIPKTSIREPIHCARKPAAIEASTEVIPPTETA